MDAARPAPLIFASSPRQRGNTDTAAAVVAAAAQERGLACETLTLRDYKLMPCRGCNYCGTPGHGCILERRDDCQRLLELFSALKRWFGSADFRGCAFINTSGETGDAQNPVRLLAKAHKRKLFEYALELCQAHGTPDPEQQAAQLLILIDGAITVALVMGDSTAADNAQCMARTLLQL